MVSLEGPEAPDLPKPDSPRGRPGLLDRDRRIWLLSSPVSAFGGIKGAGIPVNPAQKAPIFS